MAEGKMSTVAFSQKVGKSLKKYYSSKKKYVTTSGV